jgi:hypothetical protein
LARLAVGPGTKATFYPGPKGNRDKWPGTKAYFIVVTLVKAIAGVSMSSNMDSTKPSKINPRG